MRVFARAAQGVGDAVDVVEVGGHLHGRMDLHVGGAGSTQRLDIGARARVGGAGELLGVGEQSPLDYREGRCRIVAGEGVGEFGGGLGTEVAQMLARSILAAVDA